MVYCDLYHVTDILWNFPPSAFQISQNLLIALSMDHRFSVVESLQGMSNVTIFVCRIEDLNKLCRFVLTVSFVLELVQLPWGNFWEKGALWKDGLYTSVLIDRGCLYPVTFPAFNVVQLFLSNRLWQFHLIPFLWCVSLLTCTNSGVYLMLLCSLR